jgi:hypothetical protein
VLSHIRSLDIKLSILLAFFGVILIPAFDILTWKIKLCDLALLKYLPAFFSGIGVGLCLIGLIPQKEFAIPKLSALKKMYEEGMKPNQFKAELFSYYSNAVDKNNIIEHKKRVYLYAVFALLAVSFILLFILNLFQGGIRA